MKKNLIIMQDGNKSCGAACLLSIIRYYGGDISLDRLVDMVKTTKEGTNFYNISVVARKFNIIAKCFKVEEVEKIKNVSVPFIVHINNKNYTHFVVVYKVLNNKVIIMDPAKGKCVIDLFDFYNIWTGYIMLFEKIGCLPEYKSDKLINKIIIDVLNKNSGLIIFLFILSIIFTVLSCVFSLYSQIIFDHVIDSTINNLIIITIFFSVLLILKNITLYVRNHLVIYLNQKLDVCIMISSFSKVILLPYCFYKNKTTSEILSRINDLSYLKNFISKIIVSIFLDSLIFIISCIIIYSISKEILFFLFLVCFLYLLIVIIFNNIVRKNNILRQENISSVNNMIIESVSGYETIKGLNVEGNMIFRFSKLYSKILNNLYYSGKVNNIIYMLKDFVTDGGTLIVNFMIFRMIIYGELTVGDYMTITLLFGYLIYPLKNMIDVLNDYHYVKNSISRGNDLLCYSEEELYKENKLLVNGNIKIKNLNYTFNNKYYVLKGINFFIKDKEKVLLLGESGSGKSTLMKILYKYYEVERDTVYINNYDLCDYSVSDIRRNIIYISQNEILFFGTIRDNILLDRDVGEIEFLNICNIVCIDEIVKNSSLGYDYLLEEGGVNLSGGQRQRIILARSLLKSGNVIIIDEGFNQMNVELERDVLINVFNYFYNKTFIVISHRRENIDLYDRVIKINDGRIEEMEEKIING